jgi:hypothetical protein
MCCTKSPLSLVTSAIPQRHQQLNVVMEGGEMEDMEADEMDDMPSGDGDNGRIPYRDEWDGWKTMKEASIASASVLYCEVPPIR